MWLDAFLYSSVALFAFMQAYLGTEEAYKYASPVFLFWCKFTVGSCAAITGALKGFRSTTFGNYMRQKTVDKALTDGPSQSTVTEIKTTGTETKIDPPKP